MWDGVGWGEVTPEYQGWLKWPTLSLQKPHLSIPSIPEQLWRFSRWRKSYSEKAGAQNHELKVLVVVGGGGFLGFGLTDRAGTGIGEHWPWGLEPSVTNSHHSRGQAMSTSGQVWGLWSVGDALPPSSAQPTVATIFQFLCEISQFLIIGMKF